MRGPRVKEQPDPYALLFQTLGVVAETIAGTLGSDCEVVLHDLRHPSTSVVKVINGHVTNRCEGQGIRDLLGILRSPHFKSDQLVNYYTTNARGTSIKSSTAIIRDEGGEILAAICINWDLGPLRIARNFLDEIGRTVDIDGEEPDSDQQPSNVTETLEQLIHNTIQENGRSASSLGRDDRLRIVQFLDARGAFLIKGALDRIAEALSVSRHSIYKYLEEVRTSPSQ